EKNNKNIGVLEIPSFYMGLAKDTDMLLETLNSEKVDGVIVDIRYNGGCALSEATALTGLFIKSGPVVQVRDSYGRVNVNGDLDDKISFSGPMSVLVNRNSASASEIFAAALQDYGRAIVLGENSFGKGTVQQHLSLREMYDFFDKGLGYIQFTIQKFYRINGGSTQIKGVTPDILFPTAIDPEETGESVEDNALPWDSIKMAKYQRLQRNDDLVKKLSQKHSARIAKDLEFGFIAEDIAKYKAEKDDNFISLNEKVRKDESEQADKSRLARVNARQKSQGKPVFKSLDDIPKDYKAPDAYLDESVDIMLDMIEPK
ncbi:carboxy terminal-processing peptidase, partial [Vibrio caribbeanicus]|uniref:carboxy terminal-processing peptidase n=1 Tax=Vibrio caribbeanicus TaxID=701175 RepID=UPI0030D89A45